MKSVRALSLAMLAMLLASCGSPIEVSPWNPFRVLPGIVARTVSHAGGGEIGQAPPDYGWMWQLCAIGVVLFAIGSSWVAKRVTKGSLLLLGSGLFVSWWGASLKIIQKHMNWAIPYIVGVFLLWGTIDFGLRVYSKYVRGKTNETETGTEGTVDS